MVLKIEKIFKQFWRIVKKFLHLIVIFFSIVYFLIVQE